MEIIKIKYGNNERDNESGLDYAHARYYSSTLSIFPTPDPHWWRYPHQSSYVYAGNNPVMKTDPTGMDEWELNKKTGHVKWKSTSDTHTLYAVGADGKRTGASVTVTDRSILDNLAAVHASDEHPNSATTSNGKDAFNVFKFTSDNSNVEWGLSGFKDKDNKVQFYIRTDHNSDLVYTRENSMFNAKDEIFNIHSHWREDGTKGGSGYVVGPPPAYKLEGYTMFGSDGEAAAKDYRQTGKVIPSYVYHVASKGLYRYTPWKSVDRKWSNITSGASLKRIIYPR